MACIYKCIICEVELVSKVSSLAEQVESDCRRKLMLTFDLQEKRHLYYTHVFNIHIKETTKVYETHNFASTYCVALSPKNYPETS